MEAPIVYEVIINEELIQIEDVPALVCRNCGEEWLEAEVRETIERIVKEGVQASQHPS
ncbi:YgiT-type zinc finger protein [Bryobacter aggregatus]|uniref:YgiT-type zinc finger protein n=1 Tax=Bryobacter aggregatus TaxID=360054 RepID=UPI00138E4D3B|nr:YgiT-type zinc finger protein [Bryobacter aggregatus]